MSSTVSRIGRPVIVMALALLVLGSLPAPSAGAQPINDSTSVEDKIKDFKYDCKTLGGKATTRPSAMDDDKTIANCKGGGLDGYYCVYTPTTRDCGIIRDEADTDVNPGQSNITDLAPTDTPAATDTVDEAADNQGQQVSSKNANDEQASDNQPKKGKDKNKKDKKRGTHGKGRR